MAWVLRLTTQFVEFDEAVPTAAAPWTQIFFNRARIARLQVSKAVRDQYWPCSPDKAQLHDQLVISHDIGDPIGGFPRAGDAQI